MTRDPTRWLDASANAPDSVRALLASARGDEPSAQQLARLTARLGPQLAPAAGAWITGKLVVFAVVAAVGAGGAYVAATSHAHSTRVEIAVPSSPEIASAEDPVAAEAVTATLEPAPFAVTSKPFVEPRRRTEPSKTPSSPSDEITILADAQRALIAGDMVAAMRFADAHALQFPRGLLVEEREAIAIQALAKLGRASEARARLDRLIAAHPRSSYRDRLVRLVTPDNR